MKISWSSILNMKVISLAFVWNLISPSMFGTCFGDDTLADKGANLFIISAGSSNRSDSFGMGFSYIIDKSMDWSLNAHFGNDGFESSDWNRAFVLSITPGAMRRIGNFDIGVFAGPAYIYYQNNAMFVSHIYSSRDNISGASNLGAVIRTQLNYELCKGIGIGILAEATKSRNIDQLFIRGFLILSVD